MSSNKINLNKIILACNPNLKDINSIVEELKLKFLKAGAKEVKTTFVPSFDKDADIAVTIGGDGTFLSAARFYSEYDIPVLGINAGRLGFLAQAQLADIDECIKKLQNNDYEIQNRLMLKAETEEHLKYTALNDIVIKGGSISRTSRLYLYINGRHVCDYLADGIIISTPTGSTAYTLSAGGPVVVPQLNAFVIVPICPHSLTSRPLVIPADEVITVEACCDWEKIFLTADGQENAKLEADQKITISKSNKSAKIVIMNNDGFYSILRKKLHWGISPQG